MSPIEIVATIFGLASVYFTVKQNIWCWPTGLVMVFLYIFIFYGAKLYSDALLQVIYIFMQIYGWYHWVYGDKERKSLPVSRLSHQQSRLWGLVAVVGTAGWGYFMINNTDASFPYADAFIVVLSLIAQWFLARKILESWVLWIIVDVVAVYVYFSKELYPTSILYIVFFFLAIKGLLEWKTSFKKQAPVPGHVA
ncbi:MAG: hypothetical protein ACD_28C00163G0001 [uncultured bacterium]|nr:MAG: hypothetical protein ACD_28C00163G0001 [uncultured bacterium]